MRYSRFLLILIIPATLFAQSFFFADGARFAKVVRSTKEPKFIVDTVSVVSGYGILVLNKNFNREKHSVSGTSNRTVFPTITGIINDTTETHYFYACVISNTGDTLTIKSSGGAADTSKVVVQIIVK